MRPGSLIVVGTGYRISAQITEEADSAIRESDRLFHLVQDAVTHRYLEEIQPRAESLRDAYRPGRDRRESYEEMVERILAPVRAGESVCAAFYGHPGVFVTPAHEAIRRARAEGYAAEMLPGISAEDCIVAELGFDPGARGCQSFEATDFLLRHRRFDPTSHLLLWQIGGIGVTDFRDGDLWSPAGLAVLAEVLAAQYGAAHEVEIYEAPAYPICPPKRHRCRLDELAGAPVTVASTLYVPPLADRTADAAMRLRLGMPPPPAQ
jgi:precorrin-6B methylase 1